jgi:hypothetical protein
MNRVSIAKRLENLSTIFKDNTPFKRDLKAMSFVLNKMSDEKFREILNEDLKYLVDYEEENDDGDSNVENIDFNKEDEKKDNLNMGDDVIYTYWTREASELIKDNLVREIVAMDKSVCCDTGRKLTKNQIPEGVHEKVPQKPDTLKNKQTPDISKSIKSDMVKKSKGEIRKEASNNFSFVEGVELLPNMDEIEITPSDIKELGLIY